MKERIAFIGAGNVAWHLSHALHEAGYEISAIVSRKKTSAKKLAQCFLASAGSDPGPLLSRETCLFITTPDTAIAATATLLCRKRLLKKNQLVVHTGGVYGTEVLDCVAGMDALPLAMHPAASFPSRSHTKNEFSDIWFALQGGTSALKRGERMVRALGGKSLVLDAGKKPLYHLSLVFASNLFIGLEDISIELLTKCGMTRKAAKELILPLVTSTLRNIEEKGTKKALTGPIERGDMATLEKHLSALAKYTQDYQKTYRALSRHLANMMEEKGELSPETLRSIKRLLGY